MKAWRATIKWEASEMRGGYEFGRDILKSDLFRHRYDACAWLGAMLDSPFWHTSMLISIKSENVSFWRWLMT